MKREGNVVAPVTLPRDSAMHKFYAAEAARRGVGLPTHFFQLLLERFEAIEEGKIWTWLPVQVGPGLQAVTPSSPAIPESQTMLVHEDEDRIKTKGGAAMDLFGGEDED